MAKCKVLSECNFPSIKAHAKIEVTHPTILDGCEQSDSLCSQSTQGAKVSDTHGIEW